ncbi:MAG TPA: hypothetical protein QF624_11210 [Dehalococcoidia bacterium]|nr:hypothetical protein [Dehalococcoidia bacterium]
MSALVQSVLLFAALVAATLTVAPTHAQQATGTISGEVVMGTAGVAVPDGLVVELIAVDVDGELSTAEVASEGGRFTIDVAADPDFAYLVNVLYDGVRYFSEQPLLLSSELPTAETSVTVYATTADPPQLRVAESTMTVVALDGAVGQILLLREDRLLNPSDRTYTGDGRGVSLRLPVPDRTLDAGGVSEEGTFSLEGGQLAVSVPLRPGETMVVTRYLVGYDPGEDSYRMRATTSLPADRIELHVPESFVGSVSALDESSRGDAIAVDDDRLIVVERAGDLAPGASAVAELRGLSGRTTPNPLTERTGAVAGAALALVALVAGFAAIQAGARRSDGASA